MRCVSSDMHRFVLHFFLASYVENLLEADDWLSVKQGNKTNRPCHRCSVESEQMPFHSDAPKWTLSDFKKKLTRKGVSVEELTKHSMLALLPKFFSFPTVAVHPGNETYNLFRVEPMHIVLLGISKLLKKCTSEMLRDDEIYAPAIQNSSGNQLSFKASRWHILHCLNLFLADVEQPYTLTFQEETEVVVLQDCLQKLVSLAC